MAYHPEFAEHVVQAIRAAGLSDIVRVDYVDGWTTRGSSTFTPEGVGQHHTAVSTKTTQVAARNLIVSGRPDVPGPLANAHLSRKVKEAGGKYVLSIIAAGKSNHGGTGVWRQISGNSRWFGLETDNDGVGEPWPDDQLELCAAFAAGCLTYLDKGVEWQWEHKEYATPAGRKIDRARLSGPTERIRTATVMRLPDPQPAPPPPPDEEFEMKEMIGVTGAESGIEVPPGAPHWYSLNADGTSSWIASQPQRADMLQRGWKDAGDAKGALWMVTYIPRNGPMRGPLLAAAEANPLLFDLDAL